MNKPKLNNNSEALTPDMKLVQVALQSNGVYFMYKLPVKRGIRGKTKGKVDELFIVGIPLKKVQNYCLQKKLVISDRAVYENNDMNSPILFRKGNSTTYVERELL